jgi:peptidoglycan/LPS O-acetylase OafA/YrhL
MLKYCHPAAWHRLLAHGRRLAAGGSLVIALAFAWFLHDRDGLPVTVFGYPLLALGFALLILAALAPDSTLHRLRIPGAGRLALWSYAVYLVHKPVCLLVAQPLAAAGFAPAHALTIVAALAASLLAGWLLFVLVETPFMRLRARWVPDSHARRAPASALSGVQG